jgi:hypothetical protein
MAKLPLLDAGSSRRVVLRNLSRLLRSGLSYEDAGRIVLAHAGLKQFPKADAPEQPAKGPTVH